MLEVDLSRLRSDRRVALIEDVPAAAGLFEDADAKPSGPVHVEVEAQLAGADVVVRGRIEGVVRLECRRCLKAVEVPVVESFSALFTEDVGEGGAEDVYALPRARTLDLGPAVREQFLLAAPMYAVCDEACRGLCPKCGKDRNEGDCGCEEEEVDPRWAPLRERTTD